LQAESNISDDISPDSIVSKLVLLALHFPTLRLLWSSNPESSVEIFKLMKVNYKNPSATEATKIGVPDEGNDPASKLVQSNTTALDLLRRLPGVNIHNHSILARNMKSLKELFNANCSRLIELIGKTNGKKLYDFINHSEELEERNRRNQEKDEQKQPNQKKTRT